MYAKSFIFAANLFLIYLSLCSTYQVLVLATISTRPNREALSIVIGGGDEPPSPTPISSPANCPSPPPPPPPPCPPPPSPGPSVSPPSPTSRVDIATKVIQQFIKRIDNDKCGLKIHTSNFCDPKFTKYGCAILNKQLALYSVQFNECFISGKNITLVDFIDKLPDVSIFHVNSNNFCGEIPDLSHLPYLFELDLSNNKYTGKFPVNVLGATRLTFLDLRFNTFEGPIPAQLFELQVLALFINNNHFDHDLPLNLGSTPAAFITFANNYFTGPIPRSIGQASNTLLEVLFSNNKLSGCLPYEIGLLKKARVFDVSINNLMGPIPRSFACLESMQYLVLSSNKFYGPVPEEVCKLPLLKKLTLNDNYFTQVGPACMKLIQKKVLDVTYNCILGQPNQKSQEMCDWFFNEPKPCGDENKEFSYIPCQNSAAYLNYNGSLEPEGVPESEPPLTYAALTPTDD